MSECNNEREGGRLAMLRGDYPINLHLVQRVPTCKGVNRERERERDKWLIWLAIEFKPSYTALKS